MELKPVKHFVTDLCVTMEWTCVVFSDLSSDL